MRMILDGEEQMLKDAARDFFAEIAPIAQLRRLRDDKHPLGFIPTVWSAMIDLGWAAMPWREEYGGLAFGYRGLGLVTEEAGRTLAATPLWSSVWLAGSLIDAHGTDEQKRALLSDVSTKGLRIAAALEESARHDISTTRTFLTFEGVQARLNGIKPFVVDGTAADRLLVLAETQGRSGGDGRVLLLVDAHAPGTALRAVQMADSRSMAEITFADVPVDESDLLGGGLVDPILMERALDIARVGLAAELIGVARECLERTVDYIKQREQFGRKLSSFQTLRHRCADILCRIELSSSAVREALNAVDDGRSYPAVGRLASMAKAEAGEAAYMASREAIQMHGGIGMTDEFDIGFFMKRVAVVEQLLGTTEFHRDRYATLGGY